MGSLPDKKPPFEKLIISGAGPSGLILALRLAQHNIPSLVLEAYPGLDTRLRATQYGVPATRVFRQAGLLEDFRANSIESFPTITWWRVADSKKLLSLDMSCIKDHPDRMTIMALGQMIQIIYRHCLERGKGLIDVRFNHRVVDCGQDGEKAWVDVDVGEEGQEKRRERFEGDYVVGCDGASSAVRKSLFGHEWSGQTFACKLIVQNVYYDGFDKHGWDGGNYQVSPEHWGLIARRGKDGRLWRVTYGDIPGLTDEEYVQRRPWHMEAMLPGHPKPGEYQIEQTNIYDIHNRCVEKMKVGRILLCGDSAHVNNPMGGYGCMNAVLDTGGLADCFIGLYEGKAEESILDLYAEKRREIFINYVDRRSILNLNRVSKSDPWTVLDTDKFFGILKDLDKDVEARKAFLLKVSSIEYDFTQHYKEPA